MTTKHYTAIWAQAGKPSRANVSFEAQSLYHAKIRANKIAREVDSVNTPRTIMEGGRVVECIATGVSS